MHKRVVFKDSWRLEISDLESRGIADHVTNVYGPQLIDFCKNNNIFILNGRISPDADSPKRTCKNSSTVDYFLCTAHVFEFVSNLEIQEYSCLYSDAHCPISSAINIRETTPMESI